MNVPMFVVGILVLLMAIGMICGSIADGTEMRHRVENGKLGPPRARIKFVTKDEYQYEWMGDFEWRGGDSATVSNVHFKKIKSL